MKVLVNRKNILNNKITCNHKNVIILVQFLGKYPLADEGWVVQDTAKRSREFKI
jgi:hypothetical protein